MRNSVIMSCLIDQCIKNQVGFFEERKPKFLWCVSYKFDNLQKQKLDRHCDEGEGGSFTESIIANTKDENTLDPKFGNKKIYKAVPFSCCSTET